MAGINNVTLVGRLTKDPELKTTQSGISVVQTTIAVDRAFKSEGQEADFIQIVMWRQNAEFISTYARKGTLVGLVGNIQTRNYTNNEGRKVYITEVVAERVQILERKKEDGEVYATIQQPQANVPKAKTYVQSNEWHENNSEVGYNIASDDLPF